jgi:hypothetical protein
MYRMTHISKHKTAFFDLDKELHPIIEKFSLEDYQKQSQVSGWIRKMLIMTSKMINLTITPSTLIKLTYKKGRKAIT